MTQLYLQTDGLQGTTVDGTREFVEPYNPANQPLDVSGWQVQYLSASNAGTGNSTRILATIEGSVAAHGYVLLSYHDYLPDADVYFGADSTSSSGLLAHSGGHVRIVDSAGMTIDALTWGNGVVLSGWWKSVEIPPGDAVQRIMPDDPAYMGKSIFALPSATVPPLGGDLSLPVTPPQPPCADLILSEIFPNPAGTDVGSEFIEVENPTAEPVALKECSLRVGDNGTPFQLPDEALAPGAYRAFSDTESGLVLPNATAQTVWLMTSDSQQGVLYPNDMPDGHAWVLLNNMWQTTTQPSPGATNVAAPEELETDASAASAPEACPAGKERNPDTNRCRTVAIAAAPAVPPLCTSGQERNPATGRCRALAIGNATSLQPCQAGQERNPSTNRCRSVLGATTAPTPCAPGQERNPQTNRCRKTTNVSSLAAIQDVKTSPKRNPFTWWVLTIGVIGIVGYAIYEWRYDIQNKIRTRRMRRQAKQKPE